MNCKKNQKGLTLIELLAVIAIIAILFVLLIPQISNAINKSRETGIMNDFRIYQIAMESYFMENYNSTKTEKKFNEYLDESLRFKNSKSNKLNPWGEPYELEKTPNGFKIKTKTSILVSKINNKEYSEEEFIQYELNAKKEGEKFEFVFRGFEENPNDLNYDGWDDSTHLPLGELANVDKSVLEYSDNGNDTVSITGYNGSISNIILPAFIDGKKVTSIEDYAFRLFSISPTQGKNKGATIETVIIPNTVNSIGKSAFQGNNIFSVTIPNSVKNIKESAFAYNKLTSLYLPESVELIGISAFRNNLINSLILPSKIDSIEEFVFYTNEIESIEIPINVKKLGQWSFHTNNIKSLIIPNNVKNIGDAAFYKNNMEKLIIEEGLITIGAKVFGYNPNLKDVKICSIIAIPTETFNSSPIITKEGC